jgi:hypothetical protein
VAAAVVVVLGGLALPGLAGRRSGCRRRLRKGLRPVLRVLVVRLAPVRLARPAAGVAVGGVAANSLLLRRSTIR